MEQHEIDLMKRYIYQVSAKLPKNQREEITLELEELISDMYDAKDTNMEQILLELGNPTDFAKKYRNENKYLISPEYFDDYCWFLKIILMAIGISSVTSLLIQLTFSSNGIFSIILTFLGTLVMGSISGFGVITLLFTLLEHLHGKANSMKNWTRKQLTTLSETIGKHSWKPEHLPQIPNKNSLISRGDCVAGIIFTVIFCILITMLPSIERMGIMTNNEVKIISPINLDAWDIILPLILLSFVIGLAYEVIKLVNGRYNKQVMSWSILTGILQIFLSVILLKKVPFFNPNFITLMEREVGSALNTHFDWASLWNSEFLLNFFLFFVILFEVIEVLYTIYKTLKYDYKEI